MRRSFALGLIAALSLVSPPRALATAEPYVGQAIAVAFQFCPVGWVPADGSLLPIPEYETLFNLYGTTYGGDGEITFAVPDLRGRAPLGTGTGPGLTPRALGEQGGSEATTLTSAQLPFHTHTLAASTDEANTPNPAGSLPARRTRTPLFRGGSTPDTTLDSAAITAAGGGQPHENMPPFVAIHWCIAYQGIYPPQP